MRRDRRIRRVHDRRKLPAGEALNAARRTDEAAIDVIFVVIGIARRMDRQDTPAGLVVPVASHRRRGGAVEFVALRGDVAEGVVDGDISVDPLAAAGGLGRVLNLFLDRAAVVVIESLVDEPERLKRALGGRLGGGLAVIGVDRRGRHSRGFLVVLVVIVIGADAARIGLGEHVAAIVVGIGIPGMDAGRIDHLLAHKARLQTGREIGILGLGAPLVDFVGECAVIVIREILDPVLRGAVYLVLMRPLSQRDRRQDGFHHHAVVLVRDAVAVQVAHAQLEAKRRGQIVNGRCRDAQLRRQRRARVRCRPFLVIEIVVRDVAIRVGVGRDVAEDIVGVLLDRVADAAAAAATLGRGRDFILEQPPQPFGEILPHDPVFRRADHPSPIDRSIFIRTVRADRFRSKFFTVRQYFNRKSD